MEGLFEALASPIVIGVIFIVLVLLIAIPLLLRRRRSAADEEPPELDTPIDYTSLPVSEEPPGWRERFANLSLAGKILLLVVPLLIIIMLIAIWLALPPQNVVEEPPAPTPAITINDAVLTNPRQIRITADTTIPNGTEVTAQLFADGEPFPWANPDTISTTVRSGAIEMFLSKAEAGPTPTENSIFTVVLQATVADQTIESNAADLVIPPIYVDDFFAGPAVAAAPTATPTAAPTNTPEPEAPTEPPATAEPEPTTPPTQTVAVFNGGNLRASPSLQGEVLDQINAGETVELLGRTPGNDWYRIKNIRDVTGWVSVSLLTVDPQVAEQVPVLLSAIVFNGGNVREQPSLQGEVLDQINAGETVELLQKTASGQWYRIKNTRDVTGWVSVSLLTINPQVAEQVPVEEANSGSLPGVSVSAATARPEATSAETKSTAETEATPAESDPTAASAETTTPPAPAGLTVRVFNGGTVRNEPDMQAEVLGQINAGEVVALLEKTENGSWYRIKDTRGVDGWVNSALLRVAPEVAGKVPVAGNE